MLNVIIFGAPGAGKGTQAKTITEKYGLVHLSTGDILRSEKAAGTALGIKAGELMDAGMLVPDELVIGIIANRIDNSKDANGFIFDGFPRTVPQSEALDAMLSEKGTSISCVVSLDVPQDELTKRLLNRAALEGRKDDNEESIRQRLIEYETKTLPVETYYAGFDKVNKVNGLGPIDEISERIFSVLDKFATTVQ